MSWDDGGNTSDDLAENIDDILGDTDNDSPPPMVSAAKRKSVKDLFSAAKAISNRDAGGARDDDTTTATLPPAPSFSMDFDDLENDEFSSLQKPKSTSANAGATAAPKQKQQPKLSIPQPAPSVTSQPPPGTDSSSRRSEVKSQSGITTTTTTVSDSRKGRRGTSVNAASPVSPVASPTRASLKDLFAAARNVGTPSTTADTAHGTDDDDGHLQPDADSAPLGSSLFDDSDEDGDAERGGSLLPDTPPHKQSTQSRPATQAPSIGNRSTPRTNPMRIDSGSIPHQAMTPSVRGGTTAVQHPPPHSGGQKPSGTTGSYSPSVGRRRRASSGSATSATPPPVGTEPLAVAATPPPLPWDAPTARGGGRPAEWGALASTANPTRRGHSRATTSSDTLGLELGFERKETAFIKSRRDYGPTVSTPAFGGGGRASIDRVPVGSTSVLADRADAPPTRSQPSQSARGVATTSARTMPSTAYSNQPPRTAITSGAIPDALLGANASSGSGVSTAPPMATRHDGASALDLQRKDAEIARLRFELNASETAKVHAVELATLKHTAEIERLTAVHEERVKSVRLEYEARSGAAQEFQDDKAVLTKHAQSQSAAMEDLVRNINTSMTQLNTMKLAVETGLTDRTSEQASSVRATEDRTRELHDMAKQLTRDAERERIKLQDSAARMELMLREQQSRHEAEARTLKVESARVQLLLEHQETERSRVMADVDSQRSDLHIERQRIETDRQLMLKDVAVERQELVKERAAAMSLRRESEERSRAEFAERQRVQAELDDAARTLQRDAAELDLRSAEQRRQRDDIEKQARQIRSGLDNLDTEKSRVGHLAETLKARSVELVDFHNQVIRTREVGDAALAEAKSLNAHTAERTALIDRREEEVTMLNNSIQEQRLRLAKDTRLFQASNPAATPTVVSEDARATADIRQQLRVAQAKLAATHRANSTSHGDVLHGRENVTEPGRRGVSWHPSTEVSSSTSQGATLLRNGQCANVARRPVDPRVPERVMDKIREWSAEVDDDWVQRQGRGIR